MSPEPGQTRHVGGEAPSLLDEVRAVLNRHSAEVESDTPDYILATFLLDTLNAFDVAVRARDDWWGISPAAAIASSVADIPAPAASGEGSDR